jgi:hydrogenase maturation protease
MSRNETNHDPGTLIAGLGSPHGDDRLGWCVVAELLPRLPVGVTARKVGGGLELLECLEGRDSVIVIDASAPAGRPGTIRAFDWPDGDLEAPAFLSSHGVGLAEALRLAEALGRLPRRLRIVAVEASDLAPGAPLSDAVARQVATAAGLVLESLAPHVEARKSAGRDMRES